MHPQYHGTREIDDVLKYVQTGLDGFVSEKYHDQVAVILRGWSADLVASPQNTTAIGKVMAERFLAASCVPILSQPTRPDSFLKVTRLKFSENAVLSAEAFLKEWRSSFSIFSKLLTAEFQVTSIRTHPPRLPVGGMSDSLETRVRFEFVGTGAGFFREQRTGNWALHWERWASGELRLTGWTTLDETRGRSLAPVFVDIAQQAFGENSSFAQQLAPGIDHWRTVLDGACGIDIYGHNGVAIGDIDGDGLDDLYACQPAGLPNRLFRNRGDGTFEDITADSGVGLLDNTACALFADISNSGRQDLVVVRANGPLLFLNHGNGKFREKAGAFRFANPPQGTFTGAAIADYDRDGRLDIYFCLYSFYQGTDQYRYPCPYYGAENGPPNFLMHNQGDATFRDATQESGLQVNNNRFSFCCAWGDASGDGWPDLYVVNDFGRKNLYRNNGDGTFTDIADAAGVDDVGAGMSVCWRDFDGDGKPDLYVADMWTAAGVRIAEQDVFQKNAKEEVRAFFRKHAMGNSFFRNLADDKFADDTERSGTALGRWAWSSDSWDFDHDGFQDIYVANGMISGPRSETGREDLNSFFWRQVVANSPEGRKPTRAYELGWNAINELVRSDSTWSGFERNVFYVNNREGTFSDVSGIVGLDFIEDSRTFALADFDQDGRVEVLLKNRSAPQVRLLKNIQPELPPAIAFRLQGKKSNRDAIGASVTVETDEHRQTLFVQAGSGFLAQHSKELFFGLGDQKNPVRATIHWPSGLAQTLSDLPLNHRVFVEEGFSPSRVEPFRSVAPNTYETMGARARHSSAGAGATGRPITTEILERPDTAETWLLVPVAAPDFSAADLSGKLQTLSQLRGKPVLLYFLTAASPRCRQDLFAFQQTHARWTSTGLQLLAIVAGESESSARGAAATGMSAEGTGANSSVTVSDGAATTGAAGMLSHSCLFQCWRATRNCWAFTNCCFALFSTRVNSRHTHRSPPPPSCSTSRARRKGVHQGAVITQKDSLVRDSTNIPRTTAERMAKALPFAGVSDNYEFGRNYLAYGSLFFERGYPAPAEEFFKLALNDDSESAEPHYGLGSVYLQQGKSAEARKSFVRATELRANYPGTRAKAWNNLGILAAREGRTDDAIANFQKGLAADPDYSVAIDNLGNAYRQAKQWENAKSAFRRALELDARDAEANYGLGMVFAQLDDAQHAYEFLQKAIAARPDYPEALNNLGIVYLRTDRKDEAEKSFRESMRVSPEFDQSYLNLARLYAIEGDPQKARAVLLELLKKHPRHPLAEQMLAQTSAARLMTGGGGDLRR